MSLVSLLAAGKSFVGIRDNSGKYRLPRSKALPDFKGEKGKSPMGEKGKNMSEGRAETGESSANVSASAAAAPVTAKSESFPQPVCRATQPSRPSRFARFLDFLFGPARNSKNSRASGWNARAVQGELLLDRVKVVRSDLADEAGPEGGTGTPRGSRLKMFGRRSGQAKGSPTSRDETLTAKAE